ncbi:nuclear transport factor 2 family protein [Hydrogenophaga sp. OTU3427]|uniref:nuclear transport factor 2 family protein n=1 Tax=Hydrogenophaga sp. OTU3427 TaxID=3043856 RepID=UPI00313CFE2B
MSDHSPAAVRDAVTNLVCLYSHALDRRQWELLDAVFFDDALCGVGVAAKPWREWRETAKNNFANCLDFTHHQPGPSLINLQGEVALCETYCTAHHRVRPDSPAGGRFNGTGTPYDIIAGLRYSDRIELRNGTWRIAVRQGMADWRHERPAADRIFSTEEFRGLHHKEPFTDPVVERWRRD